MKRCTLRVPLQWLHLKHSLWKATPSADNWSTGYTVFSQALHFCWVPINDIAKPWSRSDDRQPIKISSNSNPQSDPDQTNFLFLMAFHQTRSMHKKPRIKFRRKKKVIHKRSCIQWSDNLGKPNPRAQHTSKCTEENDQTQNHEQARSRSEMKCNRNRRWVPQIKEVRKWIGCF